MTQKKPKAPGHLKPATAAWWESVVADFELEAHHVRLLTLAAEAWDEKEQAREALAANGLTFTGADGKPRARPEVGILQVARIAFARITRELNLDVSAPAESRAPALRK